MTIFNKMKVKKSNPLAVIPKKTMFCAGYDLLAIEDVEIKPGERININTGLIFYIPTGTYGRVVDNGELSLKHGVMVISTIIDSEFKSEVKVLVINLSDDTISIKPKDVVAKLVFGSYREYIMEEIVENVEVDVIKPSAKMEIPDHIIKLYQSASDKSIMPKRYSDLIKERE